MSNLVSFIITTKILPFDPQAGLKSRQTLVVDFSNKTITSKYQVGTTNFGLFKTAGVGNDFRVTFSRFHADVATFSVKGQTSTVASFGVGPSIDYEMGFTVGSNGVGHVYCKHDGYPAYVVEKPGQSPIYTYTHPPMALSKLSSPLDISSGKINFR